MPSFRSESAAHARACFQVGRAQAPTGCNTRLASQLSFAACGASDETLLDTQEAAPESLDSTQTSCPSIPAFARCVPAQTGQDVPRAMGPPAQFGPAGLAVTLQLIQSDIAETFCRNQGGDPEPLTFFCPPPCDSLGIRALGLTLGRWTVGTRHATVKEEFSAACARDENTWRAIARAPNYPDHIAAIRLRHDGLTHLYLSLAALDTESVVVRPAKVSLIYASVLAGLNDFERAYQILKPAQQSLDQSPSVLSLLAFIKMMGPQNLTDEAHREAVALCYGHLPGAPAVALMVLAFHYEMHHREDFATACYLLAVTRPASTALDALVLLGSGVHRFRQFRNRAHGANWAQC